MNIQSKLRDILDKLPDPVKLIAVSKTKPIEDIREAYDAGQRIFGENKVQDLVAKQPLLPGDIEWHFIGHMQTNKVKHIAPFISLIHAVDSLKLLKEINKQAVKHERSVDCLLQFHIAEEASKFGLSWEEAVELLKSEAYINLKNVNIIGVMGMSTFTSNTDQVKKEFQNLKSIFNSLKKDFFFSDDRFKEISMGMSGDFQLAIDEGSTMVRIGTSIFGERNY